MADTDDACPLDATETLDSDGDGICDNADLTPNGVVDQTFSGGVVSGLAPFTSTALNIPPIRLSSSMTIRRRY